MKENILSCHLFNNVNLPQYKNSELNTQKKVPKVITFKTKVIKNRDFCQGFKLIKNCD